MSLRKKTKVEGSATSAEPKKGSKARIVKFFVGWVFLPGCLLGGVFLAGVHWGASSPDMWLSQGFVQLFSFLFGG